MNRTKEKTIKTETKLPAQFQPILHKSDQKKAHKLHLNYNNETNKVNASL